MQIKIQLARLAGYQLRLISLIHNQKAKMLAKDIRQRFVDFFVKKHDHKQIASASVIPENDPTVLFTTAGMHPLVPYLMGEAHPAGKRLVDFQKCIRTDDIDEVGDNTHFTFFEMLGNWSLGDYFKKEAITWSYELLTSSFEEGGFGFSPDRICVSCFAGDSDAPRDEEAAEIWKSLGFVEADKALPDQKKRIYFYGKKQNWWGPAGKTGPCGPDTEIFYNLQEGPIGSDEHPDDDSGRFVEIWNNVFMQFFKTADEKYEVLAQQNVDTGMGLERMTAILQNKISAYDTELFESAKIKIAELADGAYLNSEDGKISERIVLDHTRASVFMLGDKMGVVPSNTDQGYILRRMLRRAIRHLKKLGIENNILPNLAEIFIANYKEVYPELEQNRVKILDEIRKEEAKFKSALENGLREMKKLFASFDKANAINTSEAAEKAFFLYETCGFPKEMIVEEMEKEGFNFDKKALSSAFDEKYKAHQELSRAGAEQKFSGGLADHSDEVKKLHTATHLLHKALQMVLGPEVAQKGSNITAERLRFDFSWGQKMTPEQIQEVEKIVNEQIKKDLPISCKTSTVEEAKSEGAIGLFECKYGDQVKVYTMGDFSKEICGGPHADHTGELEAFKILKEEASSSGVRRIKAVIGSGSGIKKLLSGVYCFSASCFVSSCSCKYFRCL